MKKFPILVFLLLCFFLEGCGGQGFVPAGGKVSFEDGSPLTSGDIAFSTETFMADGKIGTDGSFVLSSLKPGDGLPEGNYTVTISATTVDEKEKTTYLIDPKFGDPEKTPLKAEVKKGDKNQFDFKVTKPAK